ncbi:MAG: VTT domain-containing protein [Bryobacteraceae bacterium]
MDPTYLILIAAATLVSEDLTLAATGALVARGEIGFAQGVIACAAGIFAGDMLLYAAGRACRKGLLRWPRAAGLLARGSGWLRGRQAFGAVLMSRFTPGLRLPIYFAAGFLPTRPLAFAFYFLAAALVWTPLIVGFAETVSSIGWMAAGSMAAAWWILRSALARRGLPWVRKFAWEFWPAWLAYLPLAPFFCYLALRYRSLTVFTAANPGIPTGGLAGESKTSILNSLSESPDLVAEFRAIEAGPLSHRLDAAGVFGEWPVVLKPDVGERGRDVAIVRTEEELTEYLAGHPARALVQRYVEGPEFGLFYYRFPGEARGHILSITEKRLPSVTGDGVSTVRELIESDARAALLLQTYLRSVRRAEGDVPGDGERVPLVEVGSHCRGAIFLDGTGLCTRELLDAVDAVSRRFPGFHFGRFDVRAASVEALRNGRFRILELNGVSAEAAHIYDPRTSVWVAYRSLCRQWRLAFAIGDANRKRGARPARLRELIAVLWRHRKS